MESVRRNWGWSSRVGGQSIFGPSTRRDWIGLAVINSSTEQRYQCKRCKKTFSATKGTAFYRIHKPQELVLMVLTLLAHGCPVQAIVAAFGLDERTVARWQREAGAQCKRVHEHLVEAEQVEIYQAQADESRVRVEGGVLWLAGALEVRSRLWLGGVVSVRRDRQLIRSLLSRVRASGCVKEVVRRVVRGTEEAVQARLVESQRRTEAVVNTAYIERLQATFRARLAPLVRRTRTGVRGAPKTCCDFPCHLPRYPSGAGGDRSG